LQVGDTTTATYPFQRRSLRTAELTLAARIWPGPGDRLPLVLLHGLTESAAAWEEVAPALARRRTVIAWDARGHGESGWATDAAYAGDAHFADVVAALAGLGLERCALAGFSMGGGVAILTAGARPDLVERLVVIDAYPDAEMSPGSRQIAEWLATQARRPRWTLPFDPAIAHAFADQLAVDDPRRLDLWPFWDGGDQPALLLRGALSSVLTEEMAATMVARRPGTRLVSVPGVAHAVPALRPAAVVAAIEAFLWDV
jgi:pimeloyl-ACP methyl ester carboxylesterase